MRKLLIHLLITLFAVGTFASAGDDCRKLLKEYNSKVSLPKSPQGKEVYIIDYEVFTQGKTATENSKARIKVALGRKGMYYVSDYISMYKDEEEVYTVIHPQKLIVRSKADKSQDLAFRRQQSKMLQDSLFDKSNIKNCGNGEYKGKAVKVIELVPDVQTKKSTGIEKIVYYFNEQKQFMEGQEYVYTASSSIKKKEVRFYALEFNAKEKLKTKARDYLFEGEKLKPLFKGYKVESN